MCLFTSDDKGMSAGAAKRCEKREYLKAARKLRSSEEPRGTYSGVRKGMSAGAAKRCESANTK